MWTPNKMKKYLVQKEKITELSNIIQEEIPNANTDQIHELAVRLYIRYHGKLVRFDP
jgi:hypothetical protein